MFTINLERRVVRPKMYCVIGILRSSDTDLIIVVGAEIDGHEGQPDDACRIHGEANVLSLVEILRDFARLERV